MPTLRLETSATVEQDTRPALMQELSAAVARILGKSESYVMVVLEDQKPIFFNQSSQPAALAELRSVGTVSGEQSRALSEALADIVGRSLDIPAQRIYCESRGVPGAMWGYNRSTFG